MEKNWRVADSDGLGVTVNATDAEGEYTLALHPGRTLREAQKNAVLIASAPDLLKMLHWTVGCLEDSDDGWTDFPEFQNAKDLLFEIAQSC